MGEFKEMWKQVDALTQNPKRQYESTKAEVESVSGWKFKGCDNGVWKARNARQGLEMSDRDPERLLKKIRGER